MTPMTRKSLHYLDIMLFRKIPDGLGDKYAFANVVHSPLGAISFETTRSIKAGWLTRSTVSRVPWGIMGMNP